MASVEKTNESSSEAEAEAAPAFKTKRVQFFGRSTPIILQNKNGPCPLLAICNVLLLRNRLALPPDSPEFPHGTLLAAVAEELIDSNSHIQSKDDGYAINQQRNIGDAIDLLSKLATGIDVNVKFKKVSDFESTRECAIFDLLDIGLYHGWIVDPKIKERSTLDGATHGQLAVAEVGEKDSSFSSLLPAAPQDTDTAAAIGSKSYNALAEDLVSFDARRLEGEGKGIVEEDSVNFAAATTAASGVLSLCLSRGRSFDDCPSPVPAGKGSRSEDKEEEELTRVLNLSKAEISSPVDVTMSPYNSTSSILEGSSHIDSSISGNHAKSFGAQYANEAQKLEQLDLLSPHRCNASNGVKDDGLHSQSACEGSVEFITLCGLMESVKIDVLMPKVVPSFQSANGDESPADNLTDCDSKVSFDPVSQCTDLHSSDGRKELPDVSEVGSSVLDDNEPIYEGEEHIHDFTNSKFEDREPVYEGEIVLAEQSDKMEDTVASNSRITQKEYYLIKDFLDNNASQLTIYGLFCLKKGLKEKELCVFFRNNHFSTMIKFNGELYLLAIDEGYIDLPDLVWEKLNEVNGDSVFMTGNFTEFKIDNQVDDSWDEQSAMDYLANLECSEPTSSSSDPDLQGGIALQKDELPQQESSQQQAQAADSSRSRLITGNDEFPCSTKESKSKDCTLM